MKEAYRRIFLALLCDNSKVGIEKFYLFGHIVLIGVNLSPGYTGIAREVIPKPKGNTVLRGSATTTSSFAVVGTCTRTIPDGKTFEITKLALSCDEDAVAKIVFPVGTDISIEYKISAKIPITDWFAKEEKICVGDGSKVLRVEGKYPTGGAAGDLQAELVGEEV